MRLSKYLEQNKVSVAVFAKQIGVTRQTVHRYQSGDRHPDWTTMRAIVRETGGAVSPDDFLSMEPAE